MIRTGILTIALLLTLSSCYGQINIKKEQDKNLNSPQTKIKVNKEYDKDGNLIRYDSASSYYYSNIQNDTGLRDSIFNSFKSHFNQKYFFSDEPFFNHFFFEDSLSKYNFYKNDFFLNRFRRNMERMDSLFRGMDSVKNEFFNKQFSPPVPLKAPKL